MSIHYPEPYITLLWEIYKQQYLQCVGSRAQNHEKGWKSGASLDLKT